MAAEDYIDFDHEMTLQQRDDTHGITCKYCGADQFSWRMTDKGWRLHDIHGNIHLCRTHTAQAHSLEEHHEHHD